MDKLIKRIKELEEAIKLKDRLIKQKGAQARMYKAECEALQRKLNERVI